MWSGLSQVRLIMSTYPIASEAVDLEIYQLACIFAASRELLRLFKDSPFLGHLVETFELSEVSRKLIALAVTCRNMLDSNQNLHGGVKVGTFIAYLDKDQTNIALTFREACNKIIHADDVEYFKENSMSEGLSYEVKLYGSHSSKRWTVIFDIFKFLEAAHGTT